MNIRTLTITSEEKKYGVKYKLVPEWKSMGATFKKDVSKIRASLPSVSEDDIQKFISTKEIDISGLKLTDDHLQVTRYFDEEHPSYQAHFTNEVLVILDTALDQELIKEGIARELVNRIQRLRKKVYIDQIYSSRLGFNQRTKFYIIFKSAKIQIPS